ncbi:N-formylglutamate amidohydrolase [Alphaproteobacteria bacterium LMG 31809]|uniref:N-formylglutamate amidohydrolase n=1 Tax=Govanella unica TaxID=2975056 RepID=A0A9X3Z683_9PROT|nr:N-formylglutamate amidohydrolase [Govania unica]
MPPPFAIAHPQLRSAGFVYNSPHSGSWYPPDLLDLSPLPLATLRSSEDSFVDRLFAAAPKLGAPLMMVNVARAYVDTNREPYELDPFMFSGELPQNANFDSDRVMAGLGTIPRVVAGNRRIYTRRLPIQDALQRIRTIYIPIQKALSGLIEDTRKRFGHAVLIDCHSMPSGATFLRLPLRASADIILGDRHGTSCAPALIDAAEDCLRGLGYRVTRNLPYSGGFNTQHYGQPLLGLHALQIEINRALYMDEKRYEPTAGLAPLSRDLQLMMAALHALPAPLFRAPSIPYQESAE